MPALRLVPRIAPLTLKSAARGFYHIQRFRHHPLKCQGRRELIVLTLDLQRAQSQLRIVALLLDGE